MQGPEDEAFVKGSRVSSNYLLDSTSIFITNEVFESKHALIEWIHAQAMQNNLVVVTMRSDSGGVGKRRKRPRITFCCERSGEYRPRKSNRSDDSNFGSQSKTGKHSRPRNTGTKKCGCPFLLRGLNVGDGNEWKLEVVCGVHNHDASNYLQGHSYAGRLTEEENQLLVEMSKNFVRPKQILTTIKKRDGLNVSTLKTIYNARQRYRTKDLAGRTQMQQLLSKLSLHGYIEHHRSIEQDEVLSDLFWTHPTNVDILRSFPHVIIMDCTYKTNRYRFPLLEIVGVTSTNITFTVAFAYLNSEKEDNYSWALSRLKELFIDDLPHVLVTDRDLALMNAIRKIFPTSHHMLCTWHISNGVFAKCSSMFETTEMFEMFNDTWQFVITSKTKEEYLERLESFEVRYKSYPDAISYLKDTWLVHKEKFVSAWTNKFMHFGTTTSNRAESAHAKLKRQLGSSQLNFDLSWDNIHSLIELQHTDIKASFEKSRCTIQHSAKHEELRELRGFVSITALNNIICELKRIDKCEGNVDSCQCTLRYTHQLPCVHEIVSYKSSNNPIPLECIHPHWKKLDFSILPPKSSSRRSNVVHLKPYMIRLEEWFEEQNEERKKQLLLKLEEYMNPSSTSLKEPQVKTNNRGRPRKEDSSTRRLPSAFEYVSALSGHDSQSSNPTVGSQRKKSKVSKNKQQSEPKESQVYIKRKNKVLNNSNQKVSNNICSFILPRLTYEYTTLFPTMYQQYIANQTDVDMDGNCGYRVIAISMGFGHDDWRIVRKHLLDELRGNRTFYEDHIYGAKRFRELENCLDYFVDGCAPTDFWMTMPDMGHIIATCYGVTVIHLSSTMCVTFLPLYKRNERRNEYRDACDGGEFAIGYVGRHFVKVNLISQSAPIPPVSPVWHRYQVDNGQLYRIYEQRIDQFKNLKSMETVATRDTFIDIMHLDID